MLRIGSLFSGYGGLDLAVVSVLGASLAWHVEFDKHPSAILAHHFPGVPNYGDVSAVNWSAVEPVDILTGGFPCQDLSTAGKRAGLRPGTRSGLWEHMAFAVNQLRPELVVIENVRGLLSAAAHSDVEPCPLCVGDDPGDALRALGAVLGDLADIGYDAQWCGVRAADAGAPHGRFRVFIVAYPSDPGGRQFTRTAAAGHGLPVPAECRDEPVELFSTPTASDRFGAGRPSGRDGGDDLRTQISLPPTPAVNDMGAGKTPEQWDAWTAKMQAAHGNGNGHGNSLAIEALRLLPTPRATDGTKGGPNQRGSSGDLMLPSAVQLLPTPKATNNDNQQNLDRYGLNLGMALAPDQYDWSDVPHLLPTPRATDGTKGGPNQRGSSGDQMLPSAVQDFGPYAAAVARWEATLGRPAPAPTEPGSNGKPRLSPRFVEWMMGLPDGWVTDAGIPRNAQLKALGNGVVPQQAALALRLMLGGAS